MVQSIESAPSRASAPGRIPPHNIEAEESLLGAMLLSRDAIVDAIEVKVQASDFYKPAYGHIYDAVVELYGQGEPVDPITLAEELRRKSLLDALGGKATLLQLQAATPSSANAGQYASIVAELALLRRLIAVAGEISEEAYSAPEDVGRTLDHAESLVFEVADRRVADSEVKIGDSLALTLDQLEQLYGREDTLTGVPTGYTDVDNLLLGLQPSNLIVVAARPGMGKTAFALGAAANVAVVEQRPVLFFSMEMGHLELTKRLLAAEARVDLRKLQTGNIPDNEWSMISHAVGRLAAAPLFIDDNPHCTIMEMRAKARRTRSREGDLGLIVIDYLQLMSSPHRVESRQVEVSDFSRGLKILARELDTPVMALSQLNRQLEYRADKRPMLADLRETGCLTRDTLVTRADTGSDVSLGELLDAGERNIPVWTLDEHFKLRCGVMRHVFPSGTKPVFELRLRSGRRVKASANHPFLAFDGWRRLDQLEPGTAVAAARSLPAAMRASAWADPQIVIGVSTRELAGRLGMRSRGSTLCKRGVGREHRRRLAASLPGPSLRDRAESDVSWDRVEEIVPIGEEPVFDAEVPGTHNFLANGVVVHNSIEQDADVVMFVYRDEVYNPESEHQGMAEIIVAKHRNGPSGNERLAFFGSRTKFENMARE